MSCYEPVTAWKRPDPAISTGKTQLVFANPAPEDEIVVIPCGKCVGCLMARAKMWAIRCAHEAQMHEHNCFITLTLEEEPADLSLDHREFQLFMKRVRKFGIKTRYYMCGEYGRQNHPGTQIEMDGYRGRPHYHAILFGHNFTDRRFWANTKSGKDAFTSDNLDKLWGKGIATVQDFSIATAAYVAGYVTKKAITKENQYQRINFETGEIINVAEEYQRMSTNPGIGKTWYEKYGKTDLYNKDYTTHEGTKFRPPAYYDKLFTIDHPEEMQELKKDRMALQQLSVKNIMEGKTTDQDYYQRLETIKENKRLQLKARHNRE